MKKEVNGYPVQSKAKLKLRTLRICAGLFICVSQVTSALYNLRNKSKVSTHNAEIHALDMSVRCPFFALFSFSRMQWVP